MIRLKKITFSNIGRFKGEHTFILEGRGKLLQVSGQNLNTGGSSGSGKSTLFKAIDYNLGLKGVPATVLKSRLTKEGIETSAVYDWDGQELVISRGKKTGLVVSGVHPTTKESFEFSDGNALAEEKIDEILGVPRDVFRKMIHKRQKEGGFFIKFTPKEAYEFLVRALNLKEWYDKAEKTTKQISDLEKAIVKKDNEVSVADQVLGSAKQDLDIALSQPKPTEPIPVEKPFIDDLVSKKDGAVQWLDDELGLLIAPIPPNLPTAQETSPEIQDLKQLLINKKTDLASQLNTISVKINSLKMELVPLQKKKDSAARAKQDITELANQALKLKSTIDQAKENKCPTCAQCWVDEAANLFIESKNQEIKKIAEKIAGLNLIIKEGDVDSNIIEISNHIHTLEESIGVVKESFKEEIENLESDLSLAVEKLQKENSQVKARASALVSEFNDQMSDYNSKRDALKADYFKIVSECDKEIASRESGYKEYLRQLETFNQLSKSYQANIDTKSARVAEYELKYKKTAEELSGLKSEMLVASAAKSVIKKYLLTKFQDALEEIGTEATRKLQMLPATATTTVYFESFKEVDGKIKDEIVAMVSMDGEPGIPISSLSGGEETSLEMAIDLAVLDMLESKTGIGAGHIVLDEPCEGMDTVIRMEFIEMLKNISTGKQILIVDHTTEVKEAVDETITVIREGVESRIL